MEVALIGMSQSGKSTLFAAVTEGRISPQAQLAHQAERVVVQVPDERVDKLAAICRPKKTTYATINFVDLPGFDFREESTRHEARRLIAQARQANLLVVVLRAFADETVPAYRDRIDPAADLTELHGELIWADLELVANRIEKLKTSITKPTPHVEQDKRELELMQRCQEALENERPLSGVIESPEQEKLVRSFGFLTLKPLLLVMNISEDQLDQPPAPPAGANPAETLALSAKLEAELAGLEPAERAEFMTDLGLDDLAKDRLLRRCYESLNLVSFLTYGPDEVRAWSIPRDCAAVEAAGLIHSDIQRGFIRAETVGWSDFEAAGDFKAAKAAGKFRLEGKQYPVQDGDIITFRFNV